MIDSDLAMLYCVETKRLNESVKRNIDRFPSHFRFQLSGEEASSLRSQIATSKLEEENGKGGRRYLLYAYTEQGITMLSAVLKSGVAIQVSIRIMDTFVEMRKYMANTAFIYDRVNAIEVRQISYQEQTDRKLEQIFDYIADHKENNQKVFFDGQIFDAFALITDLIRQADKTIVLIDGYVDIVNFNAQYPNLTVKHTTAFHDRFMIIDGTTAYHIGASIKDAGKKCFGINKIEDIGVINDLLQRAVLTS